MVSPSSHVNLQQPNVELCYIRKRSAEAPAVKGGKGKSQKIRKPYTGKTLYLDLKSNKESAKFESSLKALGANVAVFLDRSVTHVVTDRPEKSRGVLSPVASASPLPTPSPTTSERSSLPRSRGAAMLDSVCYFSNTTSADPVNLANRWRIPVLGASALWRDIVRFETVRKTPKNDNRIPKVNSHFIKLEPVLGAMTRRLLKNCVSSEDDSGGVSASTKTSPLCNGHVSTNDLKVQCNGLSLNHRSSKLLSPSGSDVLPLGSQRRATRRASASWCGSTRELSQLSPTDSESGVSLRPKTTLWLPAALVGTTAEEHGNTVRRRTTGDDSRPRKKKLSPEEKLLQDNKEYFKMEVLNTKLRSSGSFVSVAKETSPQINKIILKKVKDKLKNHKWAKTKELEALEDNVDYEALIVENKIMKMNGVTKKTKKPRQSELMKLCDEAENFMFGESSRHRSASEDNSMDTSQDSVCSEDGKRRKRRSHAEAFIHDNIDYYKFETPGSRLRSQGSTCESEARSEDLKDVKEAANECRTVMFSFQTIPHTEPWFDVYTRQDDGQEMHFPAISDPINQPFLLPYELPRPVYLRQEPSEYYAKRKKRLAQIIAQNLPRKSPRCHASTLAILSSLKRRKRKSSTTTDAEASPKKREDDILGVDSDEELEQIPLLDPEEPEPNRRRKKTEDRFALRSLDSKPVIVTSQQSRPTMDVIDLIEAFREESAESALLTVVQNIKPGRGPRKKRRGRKFNKTGWDKAKVKKNRQALRNDGIAQENVLTSPRRRRDSPEESPQVTPCVVRVRKLKMPKGDESFCRKLVFTKRKRSVSDCSWTTTKR